MNPQSITIRGRRWFQKTYGNTYFSCEIFVNGENVHNIDYQYGYGNQYSWEAAKWLDQNKYIKLEHFSNGGTEALWTYCDKNNIDLYDTVIDVQQKRDLV